MGAVRKGSVDFEIRFAAESHFSLQSKRNMGWWHCDKKNVNPQMLPCRVNRETLRTSALFCSQSSCRLSIFIFIFYDSGDDDAGDRELPLVSPGARAGSLAGGVARRSGRGAVRCPQAPAVSHAGLCDIVVFLVVAVVSSYLGGGGG